MKAGAYIHRRTEVAGTGRAARVIPGGALGDRVILWLYVAGLAWAPFWYGSNDLIAWGVNAMIFPGLALLYEFSLLIRRQGHPVALRELAVPAAMFGAVVGWIGLQTIDWGWVPLDNPVWEMAAKALGRPVHGSISIDRDLTNLALLRLLTAGSAFALSLQLCRDAKRARLLIMSMVAIGAGYALYGLIASKTGSVPGLDIVEASGRVTGTYVNHNSFAAYAGVCLVVATGLILAHFQRNLDGASGSWHHQAAMLIGACGPEGALLCAAGFVLLTALLLTGSRGGALATAASAIMLAVLMRKRIKSRSRQSLITLAAALAIAIATIVMFGETIEGSLAERGLGDPSRVAVYALTIRSILDYPLLGFGYGTFPAVFRIYRDRSLSVDGIWGQAHDTYLEVLQGLGLVFGALLIGCVVVLVVRCVKGARRRQENAIVPQVAASAACLLGLHSLVDFSLQIQAITLTFMALLGAGVAQSESSRVPLED
ncbi:MAG TPA: O-antigen ligase family protein [Stellaceae bacterium]|jgi:O-antigen ligase|nr:O-antigen ligase family protein [Stellaceae bacterium]